MTVELTFKRITPPEPGRYLVYIRNKCPIAPEKGKEICLAGDWFIKNFSSEFGWKLENWEGDMLAIQALPENPPEAKNDNRYMPRSKNYAGPFHG